MRGELVTFKGVNEGIFINIQGNNLEAIKEELHKKMKTSLSFYKGTNIIGIKAENLSPRDIMDIKLTLKYKYDLSISEDELPKHIREASKNIQDKNEEASMEGIFEGINCGMTKFVNMTIRSGQVEMYPGNIVIVGDVNPGGLIQAKGNIIVLGSLRGVAHAGMGGNEKAIVAAYDLQPTQLRISDIIVRSPDEKTKSYKLPEIARIKNDKVIIEPYLPNK